MKKFAYLCLSLFAMLMNTSDVFADTIPRMMITKNITIEYCMATGRILPDTYEYNEYEPTLVGPGVHEYLWWQGTLYKSSGADYEVNNRVCNTYEGEVFTNWNI